jgi:hypothetical protein
LAVWKNFPDIFPHALREMAPVKIHLLVVQHHAECGENRVERPILFVVSLNVLIRGVLLPRPFVEGVVFVVDGDAAHSEGIDDSPGIYWSIDLDVAIFPLACEIVLPAEGIDVLSFLPVCYAEPGTKKTRLRIRYPLQGMHRNETVLFQQGCLKHSVSRPFTGIPAFRGRKISPWQKNF